MLSHNTDSVESLFNAVTYLAPLRRVAKVVRGASLRELCHKAAYIVHRAPP